GLVVGAVAGEAGAAGGAVVDTRHDQGVAASGHQHVAVVQGLPAQVLHVLDPALGSTVVLVVSRHIHPGVAGPDVTQRGCHLQALLDQAVGDVTGVGDDVGVEGVDHLGDAAGPGGAVDRA